MALSASRFIPVPPAQAWALLIDVARWPDWGPSITSATLDRAAAPGPGVLTPGSTGTVRTALGPALKFRVTDFLPGRYWAWSVAGVPATGHRVDPAAGGCTVTFTVPWWAPGYLLVCHLALRRIARLLSA